MADKEITEGAAAAALSNPPSVHDQDDALPNQTASQGVALPGNWKYRGGRKVGFFTITWYASPKTQLGMVAFVCFLCPGMFNALGGMGGAGKTDAKLGDDMNTALYSTFAVFGFFGGWIVNTIGVRLTLAFGGLGYCIYAISLLASVHAHVRGFNIFAGCLLGICAGLLWTAQGTIMISYPHEAQKGRYFAWFWAIFNLGAVVGGLIALGQSIHTTANVNIPDGTYIAFIVLMFLGAVIALFLCNADDIIRPDGSKVVLMKNPSYKTEFIGLWETLRYEPFVILLFPMFWASNWFTTYQVNAVNGAHFSTRTKALNSILYYLAQIIAALAIGFALDIEHIRGTVIRRTVRAKAAWGMLFVLTMVIWGGGYAFAKQYTRGTVANPAFKPTDYKMSGYVGPMFLYFFYGFYDALWQATVYWYMGALSNSGRRSANYVGFYKGIQSAGAAVMWSLDSRKIPFMNEFASNWALLSGALVVAAPVIFWKIKDHISVEEDLTGTDETLADTYYQGDPDKVAA